MVFIFKHFLIILLLLLQTFAPLVHAHTKQNFSASGLHVPGLESYVIQQDNALLACDKLPLIEGLLVSVDNGIKNKDANLLLNVNGDNNFAHLITSAFIFKASLLTFKINFSPQITFFVKKFYYSSHSPRAPPHNNT